MDEWELVVLSKRREETMAGTEFRVAVRRMWAAEAEDVRNAAIVKIE